MASSDKQKNAERVRWAERERLARCGSSTANTLDPLTIEGLVPGDSEGLRPASSNDLPLVVNIPAWTNLPPFPGADSTVRIEWARVGESGYTTLKDEPFSYPQDRDDFPKSVTLDTFDKEIQGRFNLRWTLKLYSDPGFVSESPDAPLRIDRTPPYDLLNPAEFILAATEINDAYLTANGDKVIVEIPAYSDYEAGDTISYGWQKVEPINPEDIVPITPTPVAIPTDRKLEIPLSLLEDGPAFCAYRLFDKAGNPSRLSHMRLRNVALGAFPVDPLDPPTVPMAEDDGLIDQLDAASREVAVVIPEVNNGKRTDQIYVTWGTQELEPHPVVPRAETRIKVPLEILKAQYTQASGEQPTPVKYEVRRGSRPFSAPGIEVQVDFSRVGPPNPDWPDITNPNLLEVEVRGDSDIKNELNLTDANKDANVLFTLYDPPVAGDEIHVMWGGVPVLPVTTITTETAGSSMVIPIPWSVIDGRSNDPALPVFYWVRRPGIINAEHSKPTLVNVNVHTVDPADPERTFTARTVPPVDFASMVYTFTIERVEGTDDGDDNDDGENDGNDKDLTTVDYYLLQLALYDDLIPIKHVEFEAAKSMVQWESRQFDEDVCSFTGYAFAQSSVLNFDPLLYARMPESIRPAKEVARGKECPPGQFLISLHRCEYWPFDLGCEPDYTTGLTLIIHDVNGNRHRVRINFKTPGNRNDLTAIKLT